MQTTICASSLVFFGVVVKGPCMEDLLGRLLLMTVNQNGLKISPHGEEIQCMSQSNAVLMSTLKSLEWLLF